MKGWREGSRSSESTVSNLSSRIRQMGIKSVLHPPPRRDLRQACLVVTVRARGLRKETFFTFRFLLIARRDRAFMTNDTVSGCARDALSN